MGKADDSSANDAKEGKDEKVTEEPSIKQNDNTDSSNNSEKVEDVESLRKVIKLKDTDNESNDSNQKEEGEEDLSDLVSDEEPVSSSAPAESSREALEQKRILLQRIKDFDLQIKKNQSDINSISEKINAISKDLDDLVSLYEIVSEQMNPFVGLSKVTKKRLESFENINKEIGLINKRLNTMEAELKINTNELLEKNQNLEPEIETEIKPEEPIAVAGDIGITNEELFEIIESSFSNIPPDFQIDSKIDEYIESLLAGNTNLEP
jgi:archaeal flagellar protein FlaC